MSDLKKCNIPITAETGCGDKQIACQTCPFRDKCDYVWVSELWRYDDVINHGHGLLGPPWPWQMKADMWAGHTWTYGDDHDNFVVYGINKKQRQITIQDIYVAESARGKGYARKILNNLLEEVNKEFNIEDSYDLFAKAVRGTTAEEFWSHVATRVRAEKNCSDDPTDWYEHPPMRNGKPRRDLAWFRISRKPIKEDKTIKKTLW